MEILKKIGLLTMLIATPFGCDSEAVPVNLKRDTPEHRDLAVEAFAIWDLSVEFTDSRRAVHVDFREGPLVGICGLVKDDEQHGCNRKLWVHKHATFAAHEVGHVFWEDHGTDIMEGTPDHDALPSELQIERVSRRARRFAAACGR